VVDIRTSESSLEGVFLDLASREVGPRSVDGRGDEGDGPDGVEGPERGAGG
jgi:hypothetical protein